MELKQALTYTIKIIAFLFGVLGACFIYLSVSMFTPEATDETYSLNALATTMTILGSIIILIAYDVIRNYKSRSIKLLVILFVITSFGQVSKLFYDDIPNLMDGDNVAMWFVIGLAPFVIMFIMYELLVFIIKKYTYVH